MLDDLECFHVSILRRNILTAFGTTGVAPGLSVPQSGARNVSRR